MENIASIKIKYSQALLDAKKCKNYSEEIREWINELKRIDGSLGLHEEPSIPIARNAISEMIIKLREIENYLMKAAATTAKNAEIMKETQEKIIHDSQKLVN